MCESEGVTDPHRTLYVSDLDQTLLGSDGTLSDNSAKLLGQALDAGALFTYATARSHGSSRRVTRALRLDLPVITYGGTVTADPETGHPSDIRFLPAAIVTNAIETSSQNRQTAPVLHTFEGDRDWLRWHPTRMTRGVAKFLADRKDDRRLRPITATDPLDPDTVHYVSILAGRDELVALREALAPSLALTAHFLSGDFSTPGLDWLEFHHPEGTKAAAITRLMQTAGAERLVVFGDNANDVPMFEIADECYAVGNAIPELKALATGVLDHHDTDAVARFIAARFVD